MACALFVQSPINQGNVERFAERGDTAGEGGPDRGAALGNIRLLGGRQRKGNAKGVPDDWD